MKQLWAPWRMDYILSEKPEACVLCVPKPGESGADMANDKTRLVLYRGQDAFVMLNRFPYASGHLMVIPYRHAQDITDLNPDESREVMELAQLSCRVLRQTSNPDGLNLGVNLGQAAGAGIRDHVHLHVVPRWSGDSQFIAVLDEVRLIPEYLEKTWERLRPVFLELA